MTPEERWTKIENAMQFITETQSRHEALHAEHTKDLIDLRERHTREMAELRELQKGLVVGILKMRETFEVQQRQTEEKLNALIDTVDRIVRHGGKE